MVVTVTWGGGRGGAGSAWASVRPDSLPPRTRRRAGPPQDGTAPGAMRRVGRSPEYRPPPQPAPRCGGGAGTGAQRPHSARAAPGEARPACPPPPREASSQQELDRDDTPLPDTTPAAHVPHVLVFAQEEQTPLKPPARQGSRAHRAWGATVGRGCLWLPSAAVPEVSRSSLRGQPAGTPGPALRCRVPTSRAHSCPRSPGLAGAGSEPGEGPEDAPCHHWPVDTGCHS